MSDSKVTNGRATAADTNEAQLGAGLTGGSAITVKALASNVGNVFIGTKNNSSKELGYPLAKGESVTIPAKNAMQLFFTLENAGDKLAWIATGP